MSSGAKESAEYESILFCDKANILLGVFMYLLRFCSGFLLLFSSALFASQIDDLIESAINEVESHIASVSIDEALHGWERKMSSESYGRMLEDCFSHENNESAKNRLIKILHENGSKEMLTSQRDQALMFHCSHALSSASFMGVFFHAKPTDIADKESVNSSSLLNECYLSREKGFGRDLRLGIRAATKMQVAMQGHAQPTIEHVAFSYAALCAAAVSAYDRVVISISHE